MSHPVVRSRCARVKKESAALMASASAKEIAVRTDASVVNQALAHRAAVL